MKSVDAARSVLIFGGAGFIGSNWANWLLQNTDSKVHLFDNLSRPGVRCNLESLKRVAGHTGRFKITIGDVRHAHDVERAVSEANEIYHFAAQVAVTTSVSDPRHDFEINLGGTFNILEAIRKAGHQPSLLFTSTNKVYGELKEHALISTGTRYEFRDIPGISEKEPLDFHSPYCCSKGAADQYVRDYARIYGIPTVVFRMSCIAGARQLGNEDQGWVAHFLYSAMQRIPLSIYGDGRQVRDILCVDDLVSAFEAVHKNKEITRGQVYNVGGGRANTTSLLELIALIEKLIARQIDYEMNDPRPGDQLVYVTDHSRLTRDTGWKPQVSLRQTLMRIQDWWKQNREVFEPEPIAEPMVVSAMQNAPGAAA